MGRGVEEIMMNQIIEKARSSGIKKIKGEFIPTAKNKPAENFYEKLGFEKEDKFWVFDTDNIMKKPEHIKVIKNSTLLLTKQLKLVLIIPDPSHTQLIKSFEQLNLMFIML